LILKYVRKEWWACSRTYQAHAWNKLVCSTLEEKWPAPGIKSIVGDIEDLNEVWICWTHASTNQRNTTLRLWSL
jgi:hypothetical protein